VSDPRIEVSATPTAVVRAAAHVKLMSMEVASEFCDAIQDTARAADAVGLVMDLGSLSRATPRAGIYAIRSLKQLGLGRIALVGGNPFMRVFSRLVLTLGRFPEFAYFDSDAAATSWAGEAPARSSPPPPPG
jgi:hypothetical protein